MDVLLIQPRFSATRRFGGSRRSLVPPMMLYQLSKPLQEGGFHTDVLDLSTYGLSETRLADYVRRWRPRVVGITSVTENFHFAIEVAALVRNALPATPIVIGGPHVTFEAQEALEFDCIDYVVRGEGDITFAALVRCLIAGDHEGIGEIPNLSYRTGSGTVHNERELIADIDALGYPSRGGVNPDRYVYSAVVSGSRGCPFRCRFCSASAMAGGKYRMRSIGMILDELDHLAATLPVYRLAFSDDTITAKPSRIEAICRHILDRRYVMEWVCASRVDVVEHDLLRLMARAGCRSIQFGFESGNAAVLKSMNKGITPEQILSATRLCSLSGIVPYGNFIIGFPEDTRATVQDTYELALEVKKLNGTCDFAVMTPFPGTCFFDRAEELGLTIHTTDWSRYVLDSPVVSTKHLSIDELRELYWKCRNGVSRMAAWH